MLLTNLSASQFSLTAEREKYENGGVGPDVWATVLVRVDGFEATSSSCVARSDWDRFMTSLGRLEASRRGEAVLISAFERELKLRFFASSVAGHIAVDGEISRADVVGSPVLTFQNLGLDPSGLAVLLQELRESTG